MAIVQTFPKANNARVDRSGAVRTIMDTDVVGTDVDTGESVSIVAFEKGFSPSQIVLKSDPLHTGTALTIKVGYIYDDTSLTSNDDFFATALTIGQTGGGQWVWPSASSALGLEGFYAEGAGNITITIDGADVNTPGDVSVICSFSYDNND